MAAHHNALESDEAATKYRGRKPAFTAEHVQRTQELVAMGFTPSAIAQELDLPRATVYRIKDDPAKAAKMLEAWAIG